jgi:hypothetical protein
MWFYIAICLIICSCQSKKESGNDDNQKIKEEVQKPVIQKIIEKTYNATAYQQKKVVSVEIQWVNQDSTVLQIFMKPDASQNLINKNGNALYLSNNEYFANGEASFSQTELKIYMQLIHIFKLPYQLNDYQISSTKDSLQLDKETILTRSYSLQGKNNITIYPHQQTDLVKAVKFEDQLTNDLYVLDKYITVKKIPICMRLDNFQSSINGESPQHKFLIKRITYPDQSPVDFAIPEDAQPLQNL